MSAPTPRTDEAYAKWQEGWDRTPFGPDFARTLERELAAERARLDWLLSRMSGNVLPANKCVAWTVDVYHYGNRFPSRGAIDAAMKEGA